MPLAVFARASKYTIMTEELSDDYVAGVLKDDAKSRSIKYSVMGLQAFLPKRYVEVILLSTIRAKPYRPVGQAPKPNTRFLRNILRETDSHNAALLAKEADESRARLRSLQEEDAAQKGSRRGKPLLEARRSEDDHSRQAKRRRLNEDEDHAIKGRADEKPRHRQSSRREPSSDRETKKHRRRARDRSADHGDVAARERDRSRDGHRRRSRREHGTTRKRHGEEKRSHRSRRHRSRSQSRSRSRSRSRSKSRSRSPDKSRHHHRVRRKRKHHSPSPDVSDITDPEKLRRSRAKPADTDRRVEPPPHDSESDPLESIVGPAPPPPEPKVRSRGRGAFTSASAMDMHFASNYDPANDVRLNSDSDDDWDQALEALRDRQRWKQQGADRLRAAGFTEDEVRKWEKGGEKNEDDVRWAKKGEGREWDRGKVVDEDGHIALKAEWGRLKGT